MAPQSGRSGRANSSSNSSPILPGRVTQANTVLQQCKVPDPWTSIFLQTLSPSWLVPIGKQQTPVPHPVLSYIVGEMKTNAASEAVKSIRDLNESRAFDKAWAEYDKHSFLWKLFVGGNMLDAALKADIVNKAAAEAEFACKVADAMTSVVGCGIWDHKPKIREKWGVSQLIDFTPLNKPDQVNFYYDIWSNIHYGYVGLAAGFSETELVDSASAENQISTPGVPEPPSDTAAIRIGFELFKGTLSVHELLKKLYEKRGKLHHYDRKRPLKERVYTTE
jgi:hypothetical protein